MLELTTIVVFPFNFISIIFHSFGIYCLHAQKGGNRNQRILLQNVSVIEIVKILYDYISFTSYYIYDTWYKKNQQLLDVIEVIIMTVIFFSFMMIDIERFFCITLNMKYKIYVTESLVKWVVFAMWMVGVTCGFVLWVGKDIISRKLYFYLVLGILVIVLTFITYSCILKTYHSSRRDFCHKSRNLRQELKILRIPFLIILGFLLFNIIPDVILFMLDETSNISEDMYHASVILWAVGYLLDPLIYIFLNRKTRLVAKTTFQGMCKCAESLKNPKKIMNLNGWKRSRVRLKRHRETDF